MNKNKRLTIYLIRHGEAGKSWTEDRDPGLSDLGREQAKLAATVLAEELGDSAYQVWSSPLLRAKETALEFSEKLNIMPDFAEIPSPPEIPLAERGEWLKTIFHQPLEDLDPALSDWRENMMNTLNKVDQNTLIFSHFMVVNSITGWINGAEKLVHFKPDYCSITKIEKEGDQFKVVALGKEMETLVR